MNLDEAQRRKVAEWIKAGLKLSEIQSRLASELGLRLTYMEARLLVDDLKLVPKDTEPVKAAGGILGATGAGGSADAPAAPPGRAQKAAPGGAAKPGGVSIAVDQIARPGAVVSGKVTFSDGNTAEWYFDQAGRLGLVPEQAGYRPQPADVQQFQMALDAELNKLGL